LRRNIIIAAAIIVVVLLWVGISAKNKGFVGIEPSMDSEAQEVYNQARQALENDKSAAKLLYQKILSQYPDYENIIEVQRELEVLNMDIIFSNALSEKTVEHEVKSGDTLGELAKKYGTTVQLIKVKNNLKSDIIRIGQRLRIWTGDLNIFVDKSQNILTLKDGDEVLKVYSVSTGQDSSTPTGEFKVTIKLVDPVWFNRGVVVPPESPQNVLGSRWLGFDMSGYGIHGTVEPETIGQQATAGCVRMLNIDVEELYSIVPLKTKVMIVD